MPMPIHRGAAVVLTLVISLGACTGGEEVFTHDDPPFAVQPPPDATTLGPGRVDDPMYSLIAQWAFDGERQTIAIATFDEPGDPDWIMAWGGQHDPATVGGGIPAQKIVTLFEGVYERHVFVTHEPTRRVVELSLAIGEIERWMERPLHEIEAEYAARIEAFNAMLASFRWRD